MNLQNVWEVFWCMQVIIHLWLVMKVLLHSVLPGSSPVLAILSSNGLLMAKKSKCFSWSYHIVSIVTIIWDTRYLCVTTSNKIAARQDSQWPQWPPCQPTAATLCPGFPFSISSNVFTYHINNPCNLMTRNPWILDVCVWDNPSLVKESLCQIPQACTLIRTCMGPGSGMTRSTISKVPLGPDTRTERIYLVLFAIYDIWFIDRFHEIIEKLCMHVGKSAIKKIATYRIS